ncbi:hypothetical protein LguiB_033700 [Lonicera macranthoides]
MEGRGNYGRHGAGDGVEVNRGGGPNVPVPVVLMDNSPAKSHLHVPPNPSQTDLTFLSCNTPDANQDGSTAGQKRPAPDSCEPRMPKNQKSSFTISSTPYQNSDLDSDIKSLNPSDGSAAHSNTIELLANFFKVQCSSEATILQFDIDINPTKLPKDRDLRRSIFKKVVEKLGDELFYNRRANRIFGGIGEVNGDGQIFKVDTPDLDGTEESYEFHIKKKAMPNHSEIDDLLDRGNLLNIHARSFQQSLKCTEQGLALCMDHTVLPLKEPLSVIDFLKQKVEGFSASIEKGNFKELDVLVRQQVELKLKDLKVKVTHRKTSERFTIKGLTDKITSNITVDRWDKSTGQSTKIGLDNYFKDRYRHIIQYLHLPCLDLGNRNFVPMELCELAEVHMNRKAKSKLDEYSTAKPSARKEKIYELVQSGSRGRAALEKLGLTVEANMMKIDGHIIDLPALKVGGDQKVGEVQTKAGGPRLKKGMDVVDGVPVKNWALVVFTSSALDVLTNEDNENKYVTGLQSGFNELGMNLKKPSLKQTFDVQELSDVSRVEDMLKKVVIAAGPELDFVICVMPEKHEGYRYIKWVSEMKIGVITQCCLAAGAEKSEKCRFFRNLALKINAKLGGTNVELDNHLLGFEEEDSIMLIGASVSHSEAQNKCSSSIAAVAANIDPSMARYAARVRPQTRRTEKILEFGEMVNELVKAYESKNKAKPKKIIIFRQGVSESQIDMVLKEELPNMKSAISDGGKYSPSITLIVVVKRHRTRLFIDSDNNENVPKGTVVDSQIVPPSPNKWNFYLCSHRSFSGTVKPTYYRVLYDENKLTPKKIQELVYKICFTCARSIYSVSLVPPLYYAGLAASRGQAFREALPDEVNQGAQSRYTLESKLKDAMFFV